MKELKLETTVSVCTYEELTDDDRLLIDTARQATRRSYVPYSHFAVGAAARLTDGTIVSGTNQENAAYPSGLCAERTTLFYANSQYPSLAVDSLAITARNETGFLHTPVTPCGACRQVMLETEHRFHRPLRVLMDSQKEIYIVRNAGSLLPLSFGDDFLKL